MNRPTVVCGLITALTVIPPFAGLDGRVFAAEQAGVGGAAAAMSPAEEWARSNPPSRVIVQAQPVPKDNAHPRVSAEEREAIGLPAPVWATDGKVHTAVTRALEQQTKLIQKERDMASYQDDHPVGLEGTAYVDMYLRHDKRGEFDSAENQAAVKELQRRVLSSLTASEFSLVFAFKNTAGLIGYINEAALAILTSDPPIVAIGLDDQPRPRTGDMA